MREPSPNISSRRKSSALPLKAVLRADPFDPKPPRLVDVRAGETLAQLVDRIGLDPITRPLAVAVIDGKEVPESDWGKVRLRDGVHVAICIAPQGGGDDGNKLLTTVLTIFVMVAAFWISGGALAPYLGAAFEAGKAGAIIAGAAVSAVGSLAISALVPPPQAPEQDKINQVYAVDGASNRFVPFDPIILSVGTRRVFPRQVARGYQELVGDDFYYRMVVEWGPIGVALSDIKVGETPIENIDGVQMQHRLTADDPHPTLYPAQVFQEEVGAALESASDWEGRTTIPDATQAAIVIGFPAGLGHTSKKGKSEQWAAQVEVRYRSVTGEPGSLVYGSWQSPPGNGVSWPTRGGVYPGAGKYGFSAKKRSQPFFRAINFDFPSAGTYEVQVRRSSTNEDVDTDRTFDDMTFQVLESRRPGVPVARDDVAYSVFRFKGSDETQGRIQTINGMVSRLIPRFNDALPDGGDLSTAGPEDLGSPAASSNPWEIILWLYRNGLDGREPLSDNAVDWASFAYAAKDARDTGWTFDHVFEGAATISEAVQTIAFNACGRAAFIGNRLTAVVDGPQLAPVAVISDRSARNVKAVKQLSRPPDGFRVIFDDAADGYRTREERVYVGDNTAATARRFEELKIPGAVHWDNVHRLVGRNYRNSRMQTRRLKAEVPVDDLDTAVRLGRWVGVQTKVVEVGRAAGWIRSVETNGSGHVTAVILDQPVSQTAGDDLVLQWNRQLSPAVSEQLSSALELAPVGADIVDERVVFASAVTGADKPQVGDAYTFGVSGFVRLDGLVDDIEAIDHEWVRLHMVDYAPERFDETGLVIPAYTPAYERPAFIRPPELELVSIGQNLDQTTIHFRIKPGDRGQAVRFIAARAIAPDSGDTEAGAWDALPDLQAADRQLVAPAGQAGDAFIYRIAAVSPSGEVGPYLLVDGVPALDTLPAPDDVQAVASIEHGATGGQRPLLTVSATPVEDVQIVSMVIEARRVALDLNDARLPEGDQPDFLQLAVIDPAVAATELRGLPAGALLDVEVYYRGARQETSPRVRVADVQLPDVDVAGAAVDYVPGSALDTYIQSQGSSGADQTARDAAAAALAAAQDAFDEAETVRSEYQGEDAALQSQINAKASNARVDSVESDAEGARTLLGNQITAAYTQAIDDAVGDLEVQINSKASATDLATAESNAAGARAQLLTDARAEWQSDDAGLQTQINSKASNTRVDTVESDAASARGQIVVDMRAEWQADDDALQTAIDAKASNSRVDTVESNAAAARSTLQQEYTSRFGTVEGNVSILQGTLAQPSGAEALVAFRVNTSSGVAQLAVVSTSGVLGNGTKIQLDANLVVINGNTLLNGTVTANKLNVTSLSAITANIGLLRTSSTGKRAEFDNNGVRSYDASGTLRVRLGVW